MFSQSFVMELKGSHFTSFSQTNWSTPWSAIEAILCELSQACNYFVVCHLICIYNEWFNLLLLNLRPDGNIKVNFIIDPLGRPIVTVESDQYFHIYRPSVRLHFSKSLKTSKLQLKIVIVIGGTVGPALRIIDVTCIDIHIFLFQAPGGPPGQPGFKLNIVESIERIKEEFNFLQAQYHKWVFREISYLIATLLLLLASYSIKNSTLGIKYVCLLEI